MIEIKTYQDFIAATDKEQFILSAISEHKGSTAYKDALIAQTYADQQNETIKTYQKMLYTLTGEAVPDNFTANHKCASGFFNLFVTQEVSTELGNGVSFGKPGTKERLGKRFDANLYKAAKDALIHSAAFGYWNFDHVDFFKLTEFVPLWDEEDGSLKSGIRFWQIDGGKPMRIVLYEPDGVTAYMKNKDGDLEITDPKHGYIKVSKVSKIDGETDIRYENYPTFPIIPLWGNPRHKSELDGKRACIDCYDLIKSGFANDLDDASMIYWTLTNTGGMTDIDLAQFVERMKTVKAAALDSDDGAQAQAHTMDVPYQSREVYLTRLKDDLYRDFMALDVDGIAAGAVTATQIRASYERLNQKLDEFEMCINDFFVQLFEIAGIDDEPTFTRSQMVNAGEEIQMLIMSQPFIGSEEVSKSICTLLGKGDRADEIWNKVLEDEMNRFGAQAEPKEEPKE